MNIDAFGSAEKINISEIDPESIRHELRALMTQMNQVELERVSTRFLNLKHLFTLLSKSHCHNVR